MSSEGYERAEDLLRRGKYGQAIEILRELLSAQPENGELRARVAEAYRLAGNLERAFHHFNKGSLILQRNGDTLGAYRMLKAANGVSANQPDIVFRMAECLKLLDNTSELDGVLRQLIQVARASGDRRRLWALEELAGRHPDEVELLAQYALSLGEAGRIDDAVTAWKRVSAHAEVLGSDFVPMLRKAAEIAAERADVGVDLADILLIARRPKDALSLLVPFYEKFPEDIGVLGALVRSLEQLGARDKVIPARIELIKTRVKRGHRELAFQEVSRLIEMAPDDPLALEVSAHTYAAFGFRGDASNIWRRLAKLHEQQGRLPERDRAILMLLKLNPDDPDALSMGARALYDAGRTKEAEALARRLQEVKQAGGEESLPAVELDSWEYSMPEHPTDTAIPVQVLVDDDDPNDEGALGDAFSPEREELPISPRPLASDLDLEVPTKVAEPTRNEEYHLPEERMIENEETTSRIELEPELADLRAAFTEEDATKLDLPNDDEDPTIPPPDDFDEFTSKTRSGLMHDLLKETGHGD